jgi:hypothetical protein
MDLLRLFIAALVALIIYLVWMATLVVSGRGSPGSRIRNVLAYSTPFLLAVLLVCVSGYLRFSDTPTFGSTQIRAGLELLVLALCLVFAFFSLTQLLSLGHRWFRTSEALGKMTPGLGLQTRRLRSKIHPEDTLRPNLRFVAAVVAANGAVFLVAQMPVFLCLLGLQAVAAIHIVGNRMIPPVVLFLSSSKADTLDVQYEIGQAVSPLIVTSLIDPISSTAKNIGSAEFHSFRSSPNVDWVTVVVSLARIVPVVVVDVRNLTKNIEAELMLMLSQGLAHKTILLVKDGIDKQTAARAFIDAALPSPRMEYKEALLDALRSMAASSSGFPGAPVSSA